MASMNPYTAVGLSYDQVEKRERAGLVNTPPDSPTKSVRRIILENLFSFFNINSTLIKYI